MRKLRKSFQLGMFVAGLIIGVATLLGFLNPADPPILGANHESVVPSPLPTPSSLEQALVKRVIDGDTIELNDGRKLRYIGIDTPETQHPTQGIECFGKEASAYNRQIVEGQTVQLEKDVSETDRYGRLLRYVWLNGELINKKLVQDGYAVASSFPPDIARQEELKMAQQHAQSNGVGLWSACAQ